MNILAPGIGVLEIGPEKQNCDFHEKEENDFNNLWRPCS
jgi:hypothetical protein